MEICRNARIESVGGGEPCEITLIFNYIPIKNVWKSAEMRELRVWEEETRAKLHRFSITFQSKMHGNQQKCEN